MTTIALLILSHALIFWLGFKFHRYQLHKKIKLVQGIWVYGAEKHSKPEYSE